MTHPEVLTICSFWLDGVLSTQRAALNCPRKADECVKINKNSYERRVDEVADNSKVRKLNLSFFFLICFQGNRFQPG